MFLQKNKNDIDISELNHWCEEISAVVRYFDFFKESKVLCGVRAPWSWNKKIDVKTKGLSFFSQWKYWAPHTNFMYLDNKPYVDPKNNEFRMFFINLDPYVFNLNPFLSLRQNFFFFFFHEFSHCLDLNYNQKIITEQAASSIENCGNPIQPNKQNLNSFSSSELIKQDKKESTKEDTKENILFNRSWNMEAFADIMAIKILSHFFPHLELSHQSIVDFRSYEAQRVKTQHHHHNTSGFFQQRNIQNFLSQRTPWAEDAAIARELKLLL